MPDRRGDRDRAEVYAAEQMALDGTSHEMVLSFSQIDRLATQIMGDPWWPLPRIPVRQARSDASSSSTVGAGHDVSIRLAQPQMTRATLVHELAHVLAGLDAQHGPRFRRAHIDTALIGLGVGPARWLTEAYDAADLRLGERTWDAPRRTVSQEGGSGAIAL